MSSWFSGTSSVGGHSQHRSHSHSHSQHRPSYTRARSSSPKKYFVRPAQSSSPHRSSHSPQPTMRGFNIFGSQPHRASSSRYGRRPREGYINRMVYQLRKIIRDLYYYARRHPMKVFMLVIMPLITGGALTGVLRQFGIRLPAGLMSMMGGMGGGGGGRGGYGGSYSGSRSSGEFDLGGGGMQSLLGIAKMFI